MKLVDRKMRRALASFAVLAATLGAFSPARATETCRCQAAEYKGENAGQAFVASILDFGNLTASDEKDCKDLCSARAAADRNFNDKTWLCQKLQKSGQHRVDAYAAFGSQGYKAVRSVAVLCSGGELACVCPKGWLSATGRDAGPVRGGKCKREAGTISASPSPDNGTTLGDWGFSWGKTLYQWGPAVCGPAPWAGK